MHMAINVTHAENFLGTDDGVRKIDWQQNNWMIPLSSLE